MPGFTKQQPLVVLVPLLPWRVYMGWTGQLSAALGLASTRASGLKSQFGTMGKPYNAGIAAANAIEACGLARRDLPRRQMGWVGRKGLC